MKSILRKLYIDSVISIMGGVLVFSILVISLLLSGCPNTVSGTNPAKPEKVTITVKGDAHVTVNEPKTIEVAKGTTWSGVKAKVKVSYKDGYEAAGFKLDSESGTDLQDNYAFNESKTVFALSKVKGSPEKVTITVKGDAHVTVNEPKTIEVAKGTTWSGVKAKVKVSYEDGYEAAGFRLDSESGTDLQDNYAFNESKTVFALSKLKDTPSQPTDSSIFKTDGNGTITGYTCKKEELPAVLVIPAKIGEQVITSIGYEAFYECTSLTSLTLPASLTTIDYNAFKDCPIETLSINCGIKDTIIQNLTQTASVKQHLKNLKLGEGLTAIGSSAFSGCTGLKELKLPASLTGIGSEVFRGCADLNSLDLSACTNLTAIGSSAFSGCTGLKELKLPASLTGIGSEAFRGCADLNSLDLSACTNLTTIDYYAFKGCTGLKELKLPVSLTEIGSEAFKDCPLETLEINCDIKDTIIQNLTQAASVKQHLKNLKLGEGISTIGGGAFFGCTKLTGTIEFPASLKTIESGSGFYHDEGTFKGCTDLQGLNFSACTELTKIGSYAFSGCAGLLNVDLSACTKLTEIGKLAFQGCAGLTSLDLSACTELTSIGEEAFKGYTGLKELKLPISLTEIGSEAFKGCAGLTSLDLSVYTSLTKIGSSAFKGCSGLKELKLPISLTEIGSEAFKDCPIETLDINCDIKDTIVKNLTQEVSVGLHLKNLKLGDRITTIGSKAFSYCRGLTGTIVFPASLKTIESGDNWGNEGAFRYCTNVQGFDFSACTNLTKIDAGSFYGCYGLTSLDLSACTSLTTIGNMAFSDCRGLKTGLTSLDLSACTSLTKIGSYAFSGYTGLKELKLPASLTEIGKRAFESCPIETLDINCDIKGTIIQNLTSGEDGIRGHLKNLKLGEGVSIIGSYAFDGSMTYNNLTSVDLSACTSLTTIGDHAFIRCKGLKILDLSGCTSLTTIGSSAFYECTGLKTLDLSGCTSLTTIGSSAFYECTGLKTLDLSGCTSLTKIGEVAFCGCTGLTKLKLPASLTEIGSEAFRRCTGLKELKLPASLTKIGHYAFDRCTHLTHADFADTNGWQAGTYSSGYNSIPSSDLADPSKAAKYLREKSDKGGHSDKHWSKS